MTDPSSSSTTPAKPHPADARLSLGALAVVLVLTHVWFFSQALSYIT